MSIDKILNDPRLRDRATLLETAGYFGRIQKGGQSWKIHCPALDHEDRNPSCSLYSGKDSRLRWHCHSCTEHGDGIDLIALLRFGGDLKQAIAYFDGDRRSTPYLRPAPRSLSAAPSNNDPIWRSRYSEIVKLFTQLCELAPDVREYLDRRTILVQAEQAGVRGLPSPVGELRVLEQLLERFPREDLMRAQILDLDGVLAFHGWPALIPWRDVITGNFVLQRRAIDQRKAKYLWPKGCQPAAPHRFGNVADKVAVVEGFFDGVAFSRLLRDVEVLAFPSASVIRPEWSGLFTNKEILVAFDPDEAGNRASDKFTNLVGHAARSLKRVTPTVGKDWNETLMHQEGARRAE